MKSTCPPRKLSNSAWNFPIDILEWAPTVWCSPCSSLVSFSKLGSNPATFRSKNTFSVDTTDRIDDSTGWLDSSRRTNIWISSETARKKTNFTDRIESTNFSVFGVSTKESFTRMTSDHAEITIVRFVTADDADSTSVLRFHLFSFATNS